MSTFVGKRTKVRENRRITNLKEIPADHTIVEVVTVKGVTRINTVTKVGRRPRTFTLKDA